MCNEAMLFLMNLFAYNFIILISPIKYEKIFIYTVGSIIVKSVPSPSLLSTFISPPCTFTISYAKLKPRPVP